MYDAKIGRMLQPDAFYDPYNPQSHNRYSYVLNNPTTYTDPTGNCPMGSDGGCDWSMTDEGVPTCYSCGGGAGDSTSSSTAPEITKFESGWVPVEIHQQCNGAKSLLCPIGRYDFESCAGRAGIMTAIGEGGSSGGFACSTGTTILLHSQVEGYFTDGTMGIGVNVCLDSPGPGCERPSGHIGDPASSVRLETFYRGEKVGEESYDLARGAGPGYPGDRLSVSSFGTTLNYAIRPDELHVIFYTLDAGEQTAVYIFGENLPWR